jgi:large subunit ribosomal protein L15
MLLNDLRPPRGATKNKKRLGRGESSGLGKTSGRGHKGQKARSGGYHKVGFEGGQMPLVRRLPKRGFHNPFRVEYAVVNLCDLVTIETAEIDINVLIENGLIKKPLAGLKILGNGELSRAVTVKAKKFSKVAAEKIEKAGGKVIVI